MPPKKGKGKKKLVVTGDNEVTNTIASKLVMNLTQDSQDGDTSVNDTSVSQETPRAGEDMKEEETGGDTSKSAGKTTSDQYEILKELNDEDKKNAQLQQQYEEEKI